jgi:hypothetical protein
MNINNKHGGEGLLTTTWGPSTWESLHCISFNYPLNPTSDDKKHYKSYFESLQFVLPCCLCRDHYSHFIKNEKTALTDAVMENRQTLTYWLYTLHNAVNDRLGMKYDITYDDLCNKYNGYIAHCELTLEQKAEAYKHSYNKEAPKIDIEYAICFVKYAKLRGFEIFDKELNNTNSINKKSDEWIKRNTKSHEIIKYMRLNAIGCLEQDGKYKGFPTLKELELMQLLSTTMTKKILEKTVKKLGYNIAQKYSFVK